MIHQYKMCYLHSGKECDHWSNGLVSKQQGSSFFLCEYFYNYFFLTTLGNVRFNTSLNGLYNKVMRARVKKSYNLSINC